MDIERMIQNLLKYKEEDDSFLDETNFGERFEFKIFDHHDEL